MHIKIRVECPERFRRPDEAHDAADCGIPGVFTVLDLGLTERVTLREAVATWWIARPLECRCGYASEYAAGVPQFYPDQHHRYPGAVQLWGEHIDAAVGEVVALPTFHGARVYQVHETGAVIRLLDTGSPRRLLLPTGDPFDPPPLHATALTRAFTSGRSVVSRQDSNAHWAADLARWRRRYPRSPGVQGVVVPPAHDPGPILLALETLAATRGDVAGVDLGTFYGDDGDAGAPSWGIVLGDGMDTLLGAGTAWTTKRAIGGIARVLERHYVAVVVLPRAHQVFFLDTAGGHHGPSPIEHAIAHGLKIRAARDGHALAVVRNDATARKRLKVPRADEGHHASAALAFLFVVAAVVLASDPRAVRPADWNRRVGAALKDKWAMDARAVCLAVTKSGLGHPEGVSDDFRAFVDTVV